MAPSVIRCFEARLMRRDRQSTSKAAFMQCREWEEMSWRTDWIMGRRGCFV